jgi:hypothetical protein
MRRGAGWFILVGVFVLGWLAWRWLFPADDVVIRKVVQEAAAAASWESGAGNLSRLAAASRLVGLCVPEVEVLLETRGEASRRLQGRDDVRQAILAVRTQAAWLQLSVDEVEVKVDEAGESARVLLAVTVRAEGFTEPLLQDYKLAMRKVEGEWLIARAEPVRGFGM